MSTAETRALILEYFETVLKDKSEANVRRFVADQSLRDHIKMFEAAFPGYQLSLEDMIVEGDKAVVRSVMTGTHLGELMGIPATGKEVSVPVMLIYRVENGKIAEFWMNADNLRLLQQINAVPGASPVH
jgi:predicted ester cyclase